MKTEEGPPVVTRVLAYLEDMLAPAACARDLMTEIVDVLAPEQSLLDASIFLESVSHTGAPVVDAENRLVGFLTLRDISKGRKAGQMHVPVRNFMTKNTISATPDTTVREIDELIFEGDVGHLPILEDSRLVGIVTRRDLLDYKRDNKRRREAILSTGTALVHRN
jgi:tRNA nucleotidyltransferase (CCA-adding enzyme)